MAHPRALQTLNPNMSLANTAIEMAFQLAKERYSSVGVDVDTLQRIHARSNGLGRDDLSIRAIHDNVRAIRFWRRVLPRLSVHDLAESRDGTDVVWRFKTGRLEPAG